MCIITVQRQIYYDFSDCEFYHMLLVTHNTMAWNVYHKKLRNAKYTVVKRKRKVRLLRTPTTLKTAKCELCLLLFLWVPLNYKKVQCSTIIKQEST